MNTISCPLCQFDNDETARNCASCGAALPLRTSAPQIARDASSATVDNADFHIADHNRDAPHETALARGTGLQNGVYVVDRVLGQGGFGITYAGRDLSLQRDVAIKEFFPFGSLRGASQMGITVHPSSALTTGDFAQSKQRFIDEARVVARFKHPAIVDVYAVFEENNTAYMVMELLDGHNMEQMVHHRNAPLAESEALEIADVVGAALEKVHSGGLLHRDIKPQNIVRCHDGRTMLIDFGTAREYSMSQSQGQTRGHTVVVTPGYAPLEQYAERAQRGAYTDVYGLAATLYFLLTTQTPPAASDRAMGVSLKAAHELNRDVSVQVSDALSRAMETAIAKRPQTIREFLEQLRFGLPAASPLDNVRRADADSLLQDGARPSSTDIWFENEVEKLTSPQNATSSTRSKTGEQNKQDWETLLQETLSSRQNARGGYSTSQSVLQDSLLRAEPQPSPASLSARHSLLHDAQIKQPSALDTLSPATQQHLSGSIQTAPNPDLVLRGRIAVVILGAMLVLIATIGSCVNNRPSTPTYSSPTYSSPQFDTMEEAQNWRPSSETTVDTTPSTYVYRFPFIQEPTSKATLASQKGVSLAQFSADGRTLVSLDNDKQYLRVWNVRSRKLRTRIHLRDFKPGFIEISNDGALVALADDNWIRLLNAQNGKLISAQRTANSNRVMLAFSADNRVLLSGFNAQDSANANTITASSTRSGQTLYQQNYSQWNTIVQFSDSGKSWFRVNENGVAFWHDIQSGKQLRQQKIAPDAVNKLVQLPNSWLLWVANAPHIFDRKTNRLTPLFNSNVADTDGYEKENIRKITAVSPEGNFFAAAATVDAEFVNNSSSINSNSADADRFVIQDSANRILESMTRREFGAYSLTRPATLLWRMENGKLRQKAILRAAQFLSFSPDGKTLFGLTNRGELMTWKMADIKWKPVSAKF